MPGKKEGCSSSKSRGISDYKRVFWLPFPAAALLSSPFWKPVPIAELRGGREFGAGQWGGGGGGGISGASPPEKEEKGRKRKEFEYSFSPPSIAVCLPPPPALLQIVMEPTHPHGSGGGGGGRTPFSTLSFLRLLRAEERPPTSENGQLRIFALPPWLMRT